MLCSIRGYAELLEIPWGPLMAGWTPLGHLPLSVDHSSLHIWVLPRLRAEPGMSSVLFVERSYSVFEQSGENSAPGSARCTPQFIPFKPLWLDPFLLAVSASFFLLISNKSLVCDLSSCHIGYTFLPEALSNDLVSQESH